ncbi:MAG: DUF1801 domain-containing protein [Sphingobacteriales bacterium]|nr:DUF1801 domain-containing protein [Sphingobacteriales bacterium]
MSGVEKYISGFEPDVQQRLHTIRNIFFEMMPETKEKISYQIPAIQAGKTYLYFAAFKNHIGFYPIISLPELEEDLKPFRAKTQWRVCISNTINLYLFPLSRKSSDTN